jgi:hypothetical protein
MKRTVTLQLLNLTVVILLGLVVIWTTSPGMSAPSEQGGATATPTLHMQLQTTLAASDAANTDRFGHSVGISGDTVVVGVPFDDPSSLTDAGSVYVYVRNGSVWTEQAHLIADDAAAGDAFGLSVAISGDTIVIGSYLDDDGADSAGSAYVFVRDGTTWTQQQKLTAQTPVELAYFGFSVSIDGDTLVVAATTEPGVINNRGAVYVFVREGTTWTQQQRLTTSDLMTQLGYSVDIYDDTIVAGAGTSTNGGAYVFTRSGTTWTQQQKLTPGAFTGGFGTGVAIYADRIIVGAPDVSGGYDQVFLYAWTGTTWELEGNGGPQSMSGYGWSVDIFQNVGLVGQVHATATSLVNDRAGAGHIITVNDDGSINTINSFQAPNATFNDIFGFAVARDGWTIIISAPNRDFSGLTDAGSVFVYDVNGPPWRTATPLPSVFISENEFFAALESARSSYPDILTIVPDFVTGAINMTISVTGNVVGNVRAEVTQEQGFVSFTFTSITVNGTTAPASYTAIINRDLPAILTTALDNLVTARFGSLANIQTITLTNDALMLSTQP